MKHIIIGFLSFMLGLWGIAANWYQFLDFLWVLVPMALLVGGILALLAGISNFSRETRSAPASDAGKGEEG